MTDPLTEQQRTHIEEALAAGRKIDAIKQYREATGKGLKDSKEAVEAMAKDAAARDPERFANATVSERSGCMAAIVATLTLIIAAITALSP